MALFPKDKLLKDLFSHCDILECVEGSTYMLSINTMQTYIYMYICIISPVLSPLKEDRKVYVHPHLHNIPSISCALTFAIFYNRNICLLIITLHELKYYSIDKKAVPEM